MANVIQIAIDLQDRMSSGLKVASGNVGSFASDVKSGAIGVTGLGLAVTGVGAAVAGAVTAVTAFAAHMADVVEQLDNSAAASGLTAQNLQILQFAFKQGGVDAGALTQGLAFMQRAIASNDPVLAKLGVTSRDTMEAFRQAAVGIAAMKDPAEATAATFKLFGRGGAQLIPILKGLAGGFDETAAAARRTGNALSEFELDKLRAVDTEFDRMSASIDGMNKRMAVFVSGPVVSMVGLINDTFDAWSRLNSLSKFMRWYAETFLGAKAGGPNVVPGVEVSGGASGAATVGPGTQAGIAEMLAERYRMQKVNLEGAAKAAAQLAETQRAALAFASPVAGALRGGAPGQTPMEVGPMLDKAKEQVMGFSELMQRVAGDMQRSFGLMGDAMYNGIVSSFVGITNSAQTFRGVMANIMRGVRDAFLQSVGEMVAAEVTKLFIKILGVIVGSLTGNPFAAIAGGAVGGDFGSPLTGSVPSAGPMNAMGAQGSGGNTYVIQTFNAKDTLHQLVSGTGSLRRANDRMSEIAAAS